MNKFNKILNEEIENVEQSAADYNQMASDVLRQLDDLTKTTEDLNMRIRHLTEQLMSSLGTEVRKRHPGLEVRYGNGRCRVGYCSNFIDCEPDFRSGSWNLSGSPFARRFTKTFPHLMKIGTDHAPLAHALADYFSNKYKTLQTEGEMPEIKKGHGSSKRGIGHYY